MKRALWSRGFVKIPRMLLDLMREPEPFCRLGAVIDLVEMAEWREDAELPRGAIRTSVADRRAVGGGTGAALTDCSPNWSAAA